MCGTKGLGRTHSRALQPDVVPFSTPDGGGRFASAPSAAPAPLVFNGLARTISAPPWPLTSAGPSASLATVRCGGAAKPLAGLAFGIEPDAADGADDCAPVFSGAEWPVAAMWIVRVRARPSRSKLISMPILRRNVAARRSRPASRNTPDAFFTLQFVAEALRKALSRALRPASVGKW
jgi:hypothetical protein